MEKGKKVLKRAKCNFNLYLSHTLYPHSLSLANAEIWMIRFIFSGLKDDRNKWSPLSTVNSAPLTSLPQPPSSPHKLHTSPAHNIPGPPPMSSHYATPSPHAPYHHAAGHGNTFASPLSALLGTGSHYLFNSEAKGPSVQIF